MVPQRRRRAGPAVVATGCGRWSATGRRGARDCTDARGAGPAVRGHRRGDGRDPQRDQAAGGRARPTSPSTRRPTGSAARGGRTPTRASPATCRRTSTPTRSRRTRTGATRSRPGAEIQAVLRAGRRRARRAPTHPLRRGGRRPASGSDGRWQLETADGHRDEVDVVIAATGVLHHPQLPRHRRASTTSPGPCFHSSRWDHDVAARRRAGRRHRHRLDGRADHRRARRPGRALSPVPAHRAVGPAAGRTRRTPTRRGQALRDDPERLAGCTTSLGDAVRQASPTPWSTPTRRPWRADRAAVPRATSRTASPIPSSASGSAPTTGPGASGSSCPPTSTRRSSTRTPSW